MVWNLAHTRDHILVHGYEIQRKPILHKWHSTEKRHDANFVATDGTVG